MSNVIAIVKNLVGQAIAISADGVQRQLAEGDHILQGEKLVTGPADSVSLALTAEGQALVASTLGSDPMLAESDSGRAAPLVVISQ